MHVDRSARAHAAGAAGGSVAALHLEALHVDLVQRQVAARPTANARYGTRLPLWSRAPSALISIVEVTMGVPVGPS